MLLIEGVKPLRGPWVGFRGSWSRLLVCVKLWIRRNLSGKRECVSPRGLWPRRGKCHSSGLHGISQSRRPGANSPEGRAPWLLAPAGAAVDQAEGDGASWKMTGAFRLPKEHPSACSQGGPDSENGAPGLPRIRAGRPLESLDLWKNRGTERPGDKSKVSQPGKAEAVPACDIKFSVPSPAREA